ncbi:MAG: hypothetical protein R2728_11235 [Chitinophagales bacterium]
MSSEQIGGIGLKTQLDAIDPRHFKLFPTVGGNGVGTTLGLSVAAFFTMLRFNGGRLGILVQNQAVVVILHSE